MADPELLLTVNGQDVTSDVRSWSSVSLTDAWREVPSLSFELVQDLTRAAAVALPAYADVRLVSLLTGDVLFEGVAGGAGGLEEELSDPHWVARRVTAMGQEGLLDTMPLQAATALSQDISGSTAVAAEDAIGAVLAASVGDARISARVTAISDLPSYPRVQWSPTVYSLPATVAWEVGTPASRALSDIAPGLLGWDGLLPPGAPADYPYAIKLFPGWGWVATVPAVAFRGAAPALTGAARPASIASARNDDTVASALVAAFDGTAGSPQSVSYRYGARTNGWVVSRGTARSQRPLPGARPWGGSAENELWQSSQGRWDTGAAWRVRTGPVPFDVLVGHSVTFDHPYTGTVTGTVQSARTRFLDGVLDTAPAAWPRFLDSGRPLDGTWILDAAASSAIPRRLRVHDLVVAASGEATRGTLVSSLRAGTVR